MRGDLSVAGSGRGVAQRVRRGRWVAGCTFAIRVIEERMSELAEASMGALKRLMEENGWPWSYGTLDQHLASGG